MKIETQRRVETLMYSLQQSLEAIEDLKQDNFYSKEVKMLGNRLLGVLDTLFYKAFKNSGLKGADYYVRLNDWVKISCDSFEKFDKLSEDGKVKYLTALANFNTINLREK